MFFYLSKTVAFFLMPSNVLILIGMIGVALMLTRFRRAGLRMAVTSLVVMTLLGFSPLGVMLSHALENRFPPWDPSRGPPDGIIVLGGAISPQLSQQYGEVMLNSDAGRITAIPKLARDYPNARIVYSGGDATLRGDGLPEGNFIYSLTDRFGIARERVTLELRSRNTEENAIFTKAMVKPKLGERWLLVTSAQHMPRAVGCFRQAGFPVEAYPVARHTPRRVSMWPARVFAGGLTRLDIATHEWIGLVAYRLTGRTNELLPGPAPRG